MRNPIGPLTCLLSAALILTTSHPSSAADVEIIEVRKIWDAGKHNAFTDLIRWHDRWWCSFRESEGHVGGDGQIRVITSADGERWESAALIGEKDIDLRDPKLSVTPDDRLMIVAGGSVYLGTKDLKGRRPRVMFSKDGREWTAPKKVLAEGDWLWRVTWFKNVAYGVSYNNSPDGIAATTRPAAPATRPADVMAAIAAPDWALRLYRSTDGEKWSLVSPLEVPGRANETTVRFRRNGEMIAMVRREAWSKVGWLGVSQPPYTRWTWHEMNYRFGGPNFIELPDASLIASTRDYTKKVSTLIGRMTPGSLEPLVTLPSGGDTSYAGMVWHENVLWLSYYSSHEGKSSIYLAKLKVPLRPAQQRLVAIDNVCAWPNLTAMKDGSIVATIFNQPAHGAAEGDVDCWASTDGRTWTKRGTAAPHDPNANRMNVAAGLAGNGDLLVIASGWSLKKDEKGKPTVLDQVLPAWISRSTDGGKTWAIDKDSFPKPPDGHTPFIPFGDIRVGGDGKLRVAVYAREIATKIDSVWIARSEDDGKTWKVQSKISDENNETALFHLGEGKWLAAARSQGKTKQRLDLFRSNDDGATWTEGEPVSEASQHPGHFARLADGRLLLTYGNRTPGRFGVLAKLSADDGKSWGSAITLLDDATSGDCGYPSSVQLKSGQIVTAYYARGVAAHLRYHMGTVVWNPPAIAVPAK